MFESLRKRIVNELPLIVEDLGEVTNELFKWRNHFGFYGIRILQMDFSTYADNIYSPHHYVTNSIAYTASFLFLSFHFQLQLKFVVETHDNAIAIEWWNELASQEEKQQFIEYIQRPFANQNEFIGDLTLEEHIDKYINWVRLLF